MTARKHVSPPKASWLDRLNSHIPLRLQALAAAALCFGLSLGLGYLVASDFIGEMAKLQHRAKLIKVDHRTFTMLILAPPILLLGIAFAVSAFQNPTGPYVPSRRKSKQQRTSEERATRWGGRFVLLMFVSIVVALFSPIPQFYIIDHIVTQRGYILCPSPFVSRREPDRWALPGPHGRTEYCPVAV